MRVWLFLAGLDARARREGQRDELAPPRRLKLPGWRSAFPRLGEHWLGILVDAGGLEPGSRVLDVGCGPGRLGAAVARYLDTGSYEGLDVEPGSILWGRREISSRYPNACFRLADVRSPQYNPGGAQDATTYRFPFADGSFDLVIATSLMTHMRPEETEHYLRESARVLRRGGRLLATFFLLTQDLERSIAGRESTLRLEARLTDSAGRRYRGRSVAQPENRIALLEDDVKEMLASASLAVEEIRDGGWRQKGGGQDLVVARRA